MSQVTRRASDELIERVRSRSSPKTERSVPPVDRAVAERAGRIRHQFGVRLPDALIAAMAVEHGMSLATRNRRDFEAVRGLRLRSVS